MYRDGRRFPGFFKFFIQYPFEALIICLLIGILRILPIDWASNLGSYVGRRLGPRIGATKRARRNLVLAMPELSEEAREQIITDMWDNLGRTIAEYPHLGRIWKQRDKRIETIGADNYRHVQEGNQPCIFVSGHIANWELSQCAARDYTDKLGLIYRRANNPLVNSLLLWLRRDTGATFFHKGPEGAKKTFQHLRHGGHLGLLVDQKLNEGVLIPFFGIPARTAPGYAALALKLNCKLILARTERLDGCRFRITIGEPMVLPNIGDKEADTNAILSTVNDALETWIRERPAQWLWIHKRWPDDAKSVVDLHTEEVTEEAQLTGKTAP